MKCVKQMLVCRAAIVGRVNICYNLLREKRKTTKDRETERERAKEKHIFFGHRYLKIKIV